MRCIDCARWNEDLVYPMCGDHLQDKGEIWREGTCVLAVKRDRPFLVLSVEESAYLTALRRHIGKDNLATAVQLSAEVDTRHDADGRWARHIIASLRDHWFCYPGEVICSTPSGYWIAANDEEIQETIGILASREREARKVREAVEEASKRREVMRGIENA